MITFLIFFARLLGKMAGILSRCQSFLGRLQTRVLTIAQSHGWKPDDSEAYRLQTRQMALWMHDSTRKAAKRARSQAILDTPKTEQTGNNQKL